MKDFIKNTLHSLLFSLDTLFSPNQLAYYSAHCKNELQIRDIIAWRLHELVSDKYGDLYVVRREWAPENQGRSRVDLAILKMDSNKEFVEDVIALIEFKAHSIARPEPSFYCTEFKRDVEKMLMLKSESICANAYLYFVFLETGQDRIAEEYKSILGYSIYQNRKCEYCQSAQDKEYLDAIKSHWAEFNNEKYRVEGSQPIIIPEPKAIFIGEAYGYKQYVSPLIIGPLK